MQLYSENSKDGLAGCTPAAAQLCKELPTTFTASVALAIVGSLSNSDLSL